MYCITLQRLLFILQTYYKDYLKLCRLYGVEAPAIDDEELDENGEVKQSK